MDSRKKYDELSGLNISTELCYPSQLDSVEAYILQQLHTNKGSKKYQDKAKDTRFKEMMQLNDREAVFPMHFDT